MIERFKSN